MTRHVEVELGFLLIAAVMGTSLWAQDGLGPMSGVGGELRRVENQAQSPVLPKNDARSVNAPVPTLPADAAAADAGPAWDIGSVRLTGDVAFAEKQGVQVALEKGILGNGPKTRREVQEVLRTIYHTFLDKGFYLARVSLPRNPYDSGTKTLTVFVEAGLMGETRVKFEGDKDNGRWFSSEQIAKRFKDLVPGETFNYRSLYDDLAEVNAHPDLTVDTKITVRKPIEGDGDERRIVRYADIDLTVKEALPFHAVFDVNNYGTESIGEWQSSLTLQYLNLTKADDVLTLNPAMAFDSSLLSFAGSYMRPHDIWNGGATTVYGGWSDLDSQDIVENIDLLGQGWFLGVVHSYKLIDDDERLVSLSAGLVYRYIEDQYLYSGTSLAQRDITVLPASLSLSYSARRADTFRGRNFATLQGVYNLATSGASEIDDWRTDADDNYVIGRMQVARLQPVFGSADPSDEKKMVHQWILFMKAEGQYASCPLLPAEELNLGGSGTLRGYTTKGYLGDNGVYGTLELRTPILLDMVSHLFGRKESNNPLDRIQFVAFTDFGYLETLDPLPGEEDSEALMSVGGGIRLAVTKYSQMRVDVGVPVASGSADDDSSAYYLDWQAQF